MTIDGDGNEKERSVKPTNRHMATLSAVYTACVKDYGWYNTDKLIPTPIISQLKAGPGCKRELLTHDEIERLFNAIRTMAPPFTLEG